MVMHVGPAAAAVCDIWQVADALATFLVRNRFAVATDNFRWYSCCDSLVFQTAVVLLVVLCVMVLREKKTISHRTRSIARA